jgi:hypothetical protein
VSWFPLPSTSGAGSHGRWTPEAESQYQGWLAKIEDGGQPKPQVQWRKTVRGGPVFRKLKANTSSFSAEFLKSRGL